MSYYNFLRFTKAGVKAIWLILKNPKNLYFVVHNEDQYSHQVKKKFSKFSRGLPEIQLTDLIEHVDEKIETYSFLGGSSEPIDIALLRILAKRFKKCKYFEIGTWRGESVSNLINVTDKRHTLNLSKSQLKEKNYSIEEIEVQGFFLNTSTEINRIESDSTLYDYSALNQMDLIFIDGDHHHEAIISDTKNVFNHLIHQNSIIVWHDYTQNFSTIWWEVLLGILKGTPNQHHNQLYHVRNTNCAVFLPFIIEPTKRENPWIPKTNYEITIKSVPMK